MSTLNTYNLKSPDSANTNLALDASGNVAIQAGSASTPSVYVTGDANTGLYSPGADQVALTTGGTARLYIDSSGRVGIGTTSPFGPGGASQISAEISGTTYGTLFVSANSATVRGQFGADNAGSVVDFGARTNHPLVLKTNDTERARIDTSGRLLVGTSSARTNFYNTAAAAALQIEGADSSAGRLSVTTNFSTATDGAAGQVVLSRSGSTTVGSNTLVANNNWLGLVSFQGADGTEFVEAAQIRAEVDGTPGANDMPGRLVFSTTADGASSPTERMRIASNGFVGVNINSALAGEKFRVANSGAGANTAIFTFDSSDDRAIIGTLHSGSSGATSRKHFDFLDGGGFSRGSISVNGSATAFNTSSDYRLKENIVPVSDGIARLQQLKPSRFNFIGDDNPTVDGFIAHEVQPVVPEAVTGDKDAVDDEGKPVYQGIDQSKLVPLLTAALQEAVAKIESLEARLTAAGI